MVHPDGIQLENSPVRVPQGTILGVPMEPIHYDEAIYPDARRFNAFRFAQPDAVRSIIDNFTSQEELDKEKTKEKRAKAAAEVGVGGS